MDRGRRKPNETLAGNAWMRVVSRYLTGSIRAGAYAANVHLASVIDEAIDTAIGSALVRHVVYLVYGLVLYELAARVVRARYRPKFVCAGDHTGGHGDVLVLDVQDYAYRAAAEKLIYESALYYGISVAIAVVLGRLAAPEAGWVPIGLGLLGAFVSVFNFMGVVIVSCQGRGFSMKKLPAYVLAGAAVAPLVVYVGYTAGCVLRG